MRLTTCTSCGGTGPFGRSKTSKSGFKSYCKKCCSERQRIYVANNPQVWANWAASNASKLKTKDAVRYAADPEAAKKRTRSWQLANPGKFKTNADRGNLVKYGLTPETKQLLFEGQGGKCAICKNLLVSGRTGMQVDHDHSNGKIRGLLCHPCNLLLGSFREKPETIEGAITYLNRGLAVLPPLSRPFEAGVQGTRACTLWYKYRLTEEAFRLLRVRQSDACGVCRDPLGIDSVVQIDHDHKLGPKAVRGLLCRACNLGLGQAREDLAILYQASRYLRDNRLVAPGP